MKNSLPTNLLLTLIVWIGPIAYSHALTPFYERQLHALFFVGLMLVTIVSVIVTVISIIATGYDLRSVEIPLIGTFIIALLGYSFLFAPFRYNLDGIVRSLDWTISSGAISLLWLITTHLALYAFAKDATNKET